MIDINVNTARFKLEIRGHAKPEETPEYQGICAAVSAIAQGLAYTITKYEKDHEAINGIDYRPEPGDMLLQVTPAGWAEAAIRKRFHAFSDALELMAMSEPQSVHMIRDGEEILPMGGEENERA
jgi:uncharacterized protein YsxB (DUF464 family)